MPIVLIDADGVLLDYTSAYLAEFYSVTGVSVVPSQVTDWHLENNDFFTNAAMLMGLEPSDLSKMLTNRIKQPGWGLSIKPYLEAQLGLSLLSKVAEIHVVTAPWRGSPDWTSTREKVLWESFRIPANHVHHSSKKHLFFGDVLIDDKEANVDEWANHWSSYTFTRHKAILFKQSYNANSVFTKNKRSGVDLHHTDSWTEILEIVRKL